MKLNKKLNGNQINNYTFFWKIACHKLETLLFPPISKKLVKKVVLWLKLQQCGPCWLVIGAQQTRLKRTPCKFTNHRRLMRPFFSKSQQQLIHTTHTCTLALVSFTDQLTISLVKIGFLGVLRLPKNVFGRDFNYFFKIDNLLCKNQNFPGLCMNEYYIVKETKMTYYKSAR